MRVELADVAKGRGGLALPPTSVAYRSGRATLITAETEQRPTVLGLIATGRMRADAGTVTVDGIRTARDLRRRSALVDAPGVSDPAPNVATAAVVAEELMFAGVAADPLSARRWLDQHGMRPLARVPIADVPAVDRERMLLELAALRPGVEALVLISPDRHGGDPHAWWATAQRFAARGFAVLVVAGEAAGSLLGATASPARRRPTPSMIRLRSPRSKAVR